MEINITKKQGSVVIIGILVICLIFIAIGLYMFFKPDNTVSIVPDIPETFEETVWKTYTDKEYGFEIEYPEHWTINTSDLPAINFYPPTVKNPDSEYTHHDNVTHFSIYPLGIPTEGVRGETKESNVDLSIEVDKKTDFILTDDTVWATSINPINASKNWKEWGFLWFGYEIMNPTYGCTNGTSSVPIEECDPYSGDQFTRSGKVNSKDLDDVKERMLKSFRFVYYD